MEKKKAINKPMFAVGIIMIILGVGVLSFYGYRKISREIYIRRLMKESINFEIPSLDIKVPVLEGTDQESLKVSAGHFEDTGEPARGTIALPDTTAPFMPRSSMTSIRSGSAMRCILWIQTRNIHATSMS